MSHPAENDQRGTGRALVPASGRALVPVSLMGGADLSRKLSLQTLPERKRRRLREGITMQEAAFGKARPWYQRPQSLLLVPLWLVAYPVMLLIYGLWLIRPGAGSFATVSLLGTHYLSFVLVYQGLGDPGFGSLHRDIYQSGEIFFWFAASVFTLFWSSAIVFSSGFDMDDNPMAQLFMGLLMALMVIMGFVFLFGMGFFGIIILSVPFLSSGQMFEFPLVVVVLGAYWLWVFNTLDT